ncbi:MAG TPA: malectin domain-containing carbohydrate-binding protein [Chthoniobacteraceae bacterium]|nr:malectin domain-containing carbohydrate-binding protein [Chthoniobacteraceae bacterium]
MKSLHLLALALAGVSLSLHAQTDALPTGTGPAQATMLDDQWRLWLDTGAAWKDDTVYLPGDIDLAKLPVNAPTGGWDALAPTAGIPVTLPGTVEEHYWGKPPLPTANPKKPEDVVRLGSPYIGVSWWYRAFTPPALHPGEHLVFSFPGARLRAEVYVNGKLVGYNLVSEIPFTADATAALLPGRENQLAVRITNPGGGFGWGDFDLIHWGAVSFPNSHGFGGIDGGVTMAVQSPVAVDDLYVANHPDPHTVTLNAEVASTGAAYKGTVALSISRDGVEVWHGSAPIAVPAGGHATASLDATLPNADLWDINHPSLYRAAAAVPGLAHSTHLTDFGFRWFDAVGLGQNPRLVLNGRRIFVSSAISWGYWAPNGMFPDKAAAQREVDAVRGLGMNCVQTHRHFPKAAVLTGFDHAGLLRYCEPGGGSAVWDEQGGQKINTGPIDPSGAGGEPANFANRYELVKILAMVKAYRSHPSVILWSMNNETGVSIHNPKTFYAMHRMHEMDPSRIAILKSGFGPNGEIMGRPYDQTLDYGDEHSGHDSFWHDNHNEDDTGVYQDILYQDPTHYKTYSVDTAGISMWGELGTANSPDDDAATVRWYQEHHAVGYDLEAAKTRLAAYNQFLDKFHFRSAFPTVESLFLAVGARHYFAASHIVENARMSDANDYIALTGWESTTIDNNSGLVDALRHYKSDPAPLRRANAPELIALHARHYVIETGDSAVVDALGIDETGRHGPFTLHFTASMDATKNTPFFQATYPVSLAGGETFGQLLKEAITFAPPAAGPITMTAWLTSPGSDQPILTRTEPLLAVTPVPAPLRGAVACTDFDGTLAPALQQQLGINATPLASAPADVPVIIVSSAGTPRYSWPAAPMLHADHATNTAEPGLYKEQYVGTKGDVARFDGFAHGPLNVELFFAEPKYNKPGQRLFDIALNGQTVLQNFDIVAASGGKARALVKSFTVQSPDGTLDLSVPNVEKDEPVIAAIRITDSRGHQRRCAFRRDNYHDASNAEWHTIRDYLTGFDWNGTLPAILDRVRKGARLVLLSMDAKDAGEAATVLAREHLLTYDGDAGYDDTPWIGHWYFCRKHWLLEGLPSNCVLDWQYQAAAPGDALKIDAPGIDPVIGYGKNPGPGLGLAAAVIPCGQGQIVLLAINGLNPAFVNNDPTGFLPVVARRIVYNALHR